MPDTSTAVFFGGLAASWFIVKYFMARRNNNDAAANAAGAANASGATPAANPAKPVAPAREVTDDMITVVSVMVPTVDRAVIKADLEQTRSVEETTERLMAKQRELKAASAPRPSDWIERREERERFVQQRREAMLAQARQRTQELDKH